MTILPPDKNGDSVVKLHAESCTEFEYEFGMRHDAAMKLLFDVLYENQIGIARGILYKH
jgi:hypothetical protein